MCVDARAKGKFPTRHGTFACTFLNDKPKKVCACNVRGPHAARARVCVFFSSLQPRTLSLPMSLHVCLVLPHVVFHPKQKVLRKHGELTVAALFIFVPINCQRLALFDSCSVFIIIIIHH